MNMTIENLEKIKCTGCASCMNICPVDAIQMRDNEEGFLYPQIDQEKCISCGLCARHCPEMNQDAIELYRKEKKKVYAAMAEDSIREKSSSGGMFSVLAEYVLEKGGYVCGAVYSEDYCSVFHKIIFSKDELGKIRGSKYVQSVIGNTYSEIKKYLQQDKWVLFTGCPCQVAGLRMFLGKDYKKLIAVDIVCHGIPSPKIYKMYLEEKSHGRKLVKVDFREKSYWGWGTAISLFFENGEIYRKDCYQDLYMKGFLEGVETRYSCGYCNYANPNRIGDITLGDFWGIEKINPQFSDGKGTGLVCANNSKGKKLLAEIKKKCTLLEEVDINDVIDVAKTRNGQFLHPRRNHWARKRFFELIKERSFSESFDYACNSKYDVGVTGWWYNENYGGTLTYFALHQVLQKMGLTVLMIAKCSWDKNYQPNYQSVPYRFAMKNYHISKNYTPETIGILNDHCKAFISGSDQLFNPTLWAYSGPQYFLDYVSDKNKIISYASSFGNGFVDPQNLKVRMAYWLNRFDALSVREDYGVDICNETFGLNAQKVMDPVFLCDVKEYEKQALKSGLKKQENYMLSFILDPDNKKREAILKLSQKLDLPYINLLNATDFDKNVKALDLDNTKPNIDIEEWLFYYMNSDFVITDSFHGTCFAIIFRKKFISLANMQRGEKRFVSLLNEVGLMNHLVYNIDEIGDRPELFEEIDYDEVYRKITPKIEASYKWLEDAIKQPKAKEINLFNILNSEIEKLKREIKQLKRQS